MDDVFGSGHSRWSPAQVAQWCVALVTWWLRVQDLVEAKFLYGIFLPLTSAEACEESWWLWKEICVSTGVRKRRNTCASLTPHDMTLAVNTVGGFAEKIC